MLMKVLKRLYEGGRYSNEAIAHDIGIDVGMVENILMQLERMGYIEKSKKEDYCPACCGCSSKKSKMSCCNENNNININIWAITPKGRQAIGR